MDFSIVFFFKQKTAYEMRISDWSSDVCSSDLIVWLDGLRPEIMDHRFHQRQSRLIGQKARIDGGRIGDHPEPETRRPPAIGHGLPRSEEHTSELQSLMRISYAVFCLKKTNIKSKAKKIKTNES